MLQSIALACSQTHYFSRAHFAHELADVFEKNYKKNLTTSVNRLPITHEENID